MVQVTLKILCVLCFAFAAAIAATAAAKAFRSKVLPLLSKEKGLVEEAADLAGVALGVRAARLLSFLGPAARPVFSLARKRMLVRADRQLPDALSLLQNALKAGLSFPQALEMTAAELADPLGSEIARVCAQMKLGRTVEEAMAMMGRRLPTEDVALVVASVAVLRRTGGNLVETFSTLAQTVESRIAVEDRIRVLTAQGVIQGAFLLAMPWILCAALYIMAPEYLAPLFSTRLGLFLLAFAILLESTGAIWLKRTVAIKV